MAKQQNPKPVLPGFSPELKENISTYESSVSNEIIVPRSAVMSPAQAENLIEAFMKAQDICLPDKITATIVICILLQTGGTTRGCDGNLSVTVNNKAFKLAQLRKVLNENKFKGGERKLARTLAPIIARICLKEDIQGNLAKQVTRAHPERTFCSF